jgi:hypothetical protein
MSTSLWTQLKEVAEAIYSQEHPAKEPACASYYKEIAVQGQKGGQISSSSSSS